MPELPEVETTVRGLKNAQPPIIGAVFLGVWSDSPQILRFKPEELAGLEVEDIRRRGKNILMDLNKNKTLLVHQKITGHLLYGDYNKEDPFNKHIRVRFKLDNGETLALSDMRKFAKIELWGREELKRELDEKLGPEPLADSFSFERFRELFKGRKARIKALLLNQAWLAGLGNIYTDELLWLAEVHPFRKANTLTDDEQRSLYKYIKEVLEQAIEGKGTSTSDYRTLSGRKGRYQNKLVVYQKEGQPCPRCGTAIKKERMSGSRSTRFCPKCQKI